MDYLIGYTAEEFAALKDPQLVKYVKNTNIRPHCQGKRLVDFFGDVRFATFRDLSASEAVFARLRGAMSLFEARQPLAPQAELRDLPVATVGGITSLCLLQFGYLYRRGHQLDRQFPRLDRRRFPVVQQTHRHQRGRLRRAMERLVLGE